MINEELIQRSSNDVVTHPVYKHFESHGRSYGIDQHGVIHQLDAKPYVYDAGYVATYDTEAYRRDNDKLQALRLGFIIGAHGSIPHSICDVGYGNGAFLKAASIIQVRYGKDVTGVEVEGVELTDKYPPCDVITFHDCLEHIPDLSFVKDLRCKTLIVSLPWCHRTGEWFDEDYKHRKPDEHLHHFNFQSLARFMDSMGWKYTAVSSHEDIVRRSTHGQSNILTMAFKR